jgi:hypothetical protein
MIIGYRRGAGKLPLTDNEKGARGTWLEKRNALLRNLRTRGHEILYWNQMTDNTLEAGFRPDPHQPVDLLIIEFAGLNMTFYGKDWALTNEMVKAHTGPILFLCDDPDLPYPWHTLPDENWARWTICVNAVNETATRTALKIPTQATVIDTPYASLLPTRPHQTPTINEIIYYGRPNGRTKQLQPFLNHITIAGKAKEWGNTTVIQPPEQSYRADWYAQYAVCLALYDNKHALTGWRTGRAYHALNAGTVIATVTGNTGLQWAYTVTNSHDLQQLLTKDLTTIHQQQAQQANPPFNWKELNL